VGWDQNRLANGDSWKVWICRLAKHNKSSTRKEGIPDNKRRKTMIKTGSPTAIHGSEHRDKVNGVEMS